MENAVNKIINSRIEYIDVAKGIGIFLVVYAHVLYNWNWIAMSICSYHMPFFFLLSGLFAINKDIKFRDYLLKQFKTLLLPFFVFVVIDYVLQFAAALYTKTVNLSEFIANFFLSLSGIKFTVLNGPIWFIFSLFVVKIIYYFIKKNNFLKIVIGLLCFLFIVFVIFEVIKIDPFLHCLYLESICGLLFFIVGSYCKPYIKKTEKVINNHKVISAVILLILVFAIIKLAKINGHVSMANCIFGNYISLFILDSFIGTAVIIIISVLISNMKYFKSIILFFGVNSIIVLLLHDYAIKAVETVLSRFVNTADLLTNNIWFQTAVTIVVMIIISIAIPIFNRFFPFIIGKKREKSIKEQN